MKRSSGSIVRFMLLAIGLTIGCPMSSGDSLLPAAKHDARGNLLPLQSYGETIRRGMKFILVDQKTWAKDNKLTDENGATLPPYFLYSIAHDGKLDGVGAALNRNMAYPAFHHALYIETFLAYYVYSGDPEMIEHAEALAKWNIAHSTPADWKYGNLPYSTVANGRCGGGADGDAVMTDKPAVMGLGLSAAVSHDAKADLPRRSREDRPDVGQDPIVGRQLALPRQSENRRGQGTVHQQRRLRRRTV